MTSPEEIDVLRAVLAKHFAHLAKTIRGYNMPGFLKDAIDSNIAKIGHGAIESACSAVNPEYTAQPWAPPVKPDTTGPVDVSPAAITAATSAAGSDQVAKDRKALGLD